MKNKKILILALLISGNLVAGDKPESATYTEGMSESAKRLSERMSGEPIPAIIKITNHLLDSHNENEKSLGHLDEVLESPDVNVDDKDDLGNTALMHALGRHDKSTRKVVNYLLRRGANVNVKNKKGATPLTVALQSADPRFNDESSEIIKDLLRHGASVEDETFNYAKDEETRNLLRESKGATDALLDAASKGSLDVINDLLGKGAYVNTRDRWGNTPLMNAARNASPRVVQSLLDKGADANLTNQAGHTALSLALMHNNSDSAIHILNKTQNVNTQDEIGNTPLMYAAANDSKNVVNALLSKGADVNIPNRVGGTPIFAARDKHIIEALARSGIDLNAINDKGETLLSRAAFLGLDSHIKTLVENGAKVDKTNAKGETPIALALKADYPTAVKTLLEYGASDPKGAYYAYLQEKERAHQERIKKSRRRIID